LYFQTEVSMGNLCRTRNIGLVLLSLGVFSCSTRSPVAQVKDQAGTEAGAGQVASAATRKSSETETGHRGGGHRAPAPAPLAAEQGSTGPLVGYAVAYGRSGDARSLPPSQASS